jgi:hypothetical protein
MKIRAIAPMLIIISGLVGTTGCHHIHRDYHRWRDQHHDRRYDGDRYDRDGYDNGRQRGWYKD